MNDEQAQASTFSPRDVSDEELERMLFGDVEVTDIHDDAPLDAATPPVARETPPPTGGAPPRRDLLRRIRWRIRHAFRGSDHQRVLEPYRDEDVTPFPELAAGERVLASHAVNPPFAYVRIVADAQGSRPRYEVVEPPLDGQGQALYQYMREAFRRTLDIDYDEMEAAGARAYVARQFDRIAARHDMRLDALKRARLLYYIERDFLGYGPIDAVMRDTELEDISCDGPNVPVFLFHRRHESIETNIVFADDQTLDGFVMQLVQKCGKHISVSEPLTDASLPDGSRLQASLTREVTTRGSTFTIRRFRADPLTPTDLMLFGTASAEIIAWLWMAVEYGSSGIVAGGTASGKTTTLNALSVFIPQRKKIVSIEDTRELNLVHRNWIPGVTRAGGAARDSAGRRAGEVDMFDLLKAALRQRPEYLLLGEVRGAEASVLFQAMATGHTVYSTMHADSVASAVHRLESRPIEIPRNMLASLDFVAVQAETRVAHQRARKLREVVEIVGIDPRTDELLTNRVFHWEPATRRFKFAGASHILDRIADEHYHADRAGVRAEFARRVRFLNALARQEVRDLAAVTERVDAYERDAEATLARLEAEP